MHSGTAILESRSGRSGNAGSGIPGGGNGRLPRSWETPRHAYITAMILAFAGIAMFFAAFISADVVRKGSPSGDWRHLTVPHILWLNTAVLLASSLTLARARRRFLAHDEPDFRHWWRITAILGSFFLIGQFVAWRQLASAGIYLATNPAGSFFYTLTAAHGLHLAAGLIGLLVVAIRKSSAFTPTAIDLVGMYWHFMNAIWICLFFFLLAF